MSGNEWDDNENENVPKALRDHLKKVEADLKAQRELNEKLAADNRVNAITSVLRTRGHNPKIAALVPSTVDATEEKLTAWLDENAELFPVAPKGTPADGAVQTSVPAEEEAPVDRMGSAAALGMPPERIRAIETEIDNAKSSEDLEKILGAHKGVRFK